MLTPNDIQSLLSRAKSLSPVPDIELSVHQVHADLTRFANNTIHQNVNEENLNVSLRVLVEGRDARVTTSKTDDESLRRALESAVAIAREQEPDPEMMPLPEPSNDDFGPGPSRFFDVTAALTPQARADAVRQMVDVAKSHDLTAAGIFSSGQSVYAIANSKGRFQFHTETSAEVSITMLGKDSSGWQKANSPDVAQLDPVRLAETAAEKAVASAAPKEVPPGRYTVILEPAAVLDLLGFMFWDFGGLSLLDQRSFLLNRVGRKLFGGNIHITDDVYHPLQSGAPFDGEGMRRQRVPLVEGGVVKSLVYARATAEKVRRSAIAQALGEVRPTGHGFPLPNEMGEAPMNIVVESAPASEQMTLRQMIEGTERGILVTRLWYIREVEPYEKMLTGMTRDGTFLVENGRVQHGVRNFRFNQSLVEMLNRVVAMGAPVRASGEESFDMVVPAMKVEGFHFTEVTRF